MKGKFVLRVTLMEKYIRKIDDSAKNFAPRSEEEHEFYNQVLHSICAKLERDPHRPS